MHNPWLDLQPIGDRLVHPDDAAYVDAFNEVVRPEHRLVTSAWPQPWAGPINTARVLILAANPGWSADDEHAERQLAPLLEENLTGDRPMFWLDPAAAGSPGSRWVRSRLLSSVLAELPDDAAENVVAGSVCLVEFHPYHATKWKPIPITLPSQQHTFSLVRARIADGATVIVTRARREWTVAVPELLRCDQLFATRSVQNVHLSASNLGPNGWEALMGRLHAVHRSYFGG